MNERMFRNLVGTDVYIIMLMELPTGLPETTREAYWGILVQTVNQGIKNIDDLIRLAHSWLALYRNIQYEIRKRVA